MKKKHNKLDIVYEDKFIIVINKPCKILTIKDLACGKNLYEMVYDYLHKKNQKCFIVHRLDKDTSGLIVFAKSQAVKMTLQADWENVIRKYYAIVEKEVKQSGKIRSYLQETSTHLTYISNNEKKGKLAITWYFPLKECKSYTLLDVEIKTGRKNQIRVQLSSIGHPIIGDKKYGGTKNPVSRLGLHAYYLEFRHPVTKDMMVLKTNIPREFDSIFRDCN